MNMFILKIKGQDEKEVYLKDNYKKMTETELTQLVTEIADDAKKFDYDKNENNDIREFIKENAKAIHEKNINNTFAKAFFNEVSIR